MRSSVVWKLGKLFVMFVALALLSYAITRTASPSAVTQEVRSTSSVPQSSNFMASGGLVADTDPSVPDASEALSHSTVAVPTSEDARTF